MCISSSIVDFYKKNTGLWRCDIAKPQGSVGFDNFFLYDADGGLGDCLAITALPEVGLQNKKHFGIKSFGKHLSSLQPYFNLSANVIAEIEKVLQQGCLNPKILVETFCYNGHYIQQIHKSLGLNTPDLPRGGLKLQKNEEIQKNKVVLNFNAGEHSSVQKQTIHPRAREFYAEHRETIQKFIFANSQYDFVEVGTEFSDLENVKNETGKPLNVAIDHLYQADFYLGINSGITNLAAAIGVKSIVMLNFPNAEYIKLPQIVRLNLPDMDWLYPQNVHLHMDEDSDLCRIFSYQNLEKAFNGEIYPFFRQDYISLIHEKIQ